MSNVKRYDPEVSGTHLPVATMEPDPKGDYVRFADYEKLQAENQRLREAFKELQAEYADLAKMAGEIDKGDDDGTDGGALLVRR